MNIHRGIQSFNGNPIPKIVFGAGSVFQLADEIVKLGQFPLLVTGGRSFVENPAWDHLINELNELGAVYQHIRIVGEPDVETIDQIVKQLRPTAVDLVVGIGGGSAIDAAKAIAGMVPVSLEK